MGIFLMICTFISIKCFPLVFVSLFASIYPLLVALLSYILYKVALSKIDVGVLIVSFVGVIFLIIGSIDDGKGEEETQSTITLLPILALLLIPIIQCII